MIRLEGTDGDVVAVARAAVRTLRRDRTTRRGLYPRLAAHHAARRRLAQTPAPPGSPFARRVGLALWWLLYGAGLVAVLAAAALAGPPGRKTTYLRAEDAMPVATTAAVVGVVLLGVVLVLRTPRGGGTPLAATTLGVTTGGLVLLLVGYRLVVGTGDDRGVTADQLRTWSPPAVLAILALVAVTVRVDRTRRRTPEEVPAGASRRDQERHLRRRAAELATTAPARPAAEVAAEWHGRLDRLERQGVDPRTTAQARTMTPAAWLVHTFDDGDRDVTGILE